MAQKFEIIDGEMVIVRDDFVPGDTTPSVLPRYITVVDNFLEGEQRDTIIFSLDERLRDRAIGGLVERGSGGDPAEINNRDFGGNILVDANPDSSPMYITALMRSPIYRPIIVNEVIDQEFTEFA